MVSNETTVNRIRHQVLLEVAKLAWDGELEKKRDEIPFQIIPGPQAQFRCCIYKEREIIRQRVRLAEGKCPTGKESPNVIQVINAACEECPIASYLVTDNCRKCMGKACQSACNFGAISMGDTRAYIDPRRRARWTPLPMTSTGSASSMRRNVSPAATVSPAVRSAPSRRRLRW